VFVYCWHPFGPVHQHINSLLFDSVLVSTAVLFVCFTLSCRIMTWQILAPVAMTVSVDPADSIAALSNLFWCKFSRRRAVLMSSISPSKQSNVVPVAYSRRKFRSKCQRQPLCNLLFGSHQ